jgi:hypothetical protein
MKPRETAGASEENAHRDKIKTEIENPASAGTDGRDR